MEIMAEELTEKDSKTVQQCKDHLGYFIAYKDLFSTWKDHTATFTVSDVTDALNAFVRNIGSNPDHQKRTRTSACCIPDIDRRADQHKQHDFRCQPELAEFFREPLGNERRALHLK